MESHSKKSSNQKWNLEDGPQKDTYLAGAQPPTSCSFARHLVGKIAILGSFAHH